MGMITATLSKVCAAFVGPFASESVLRKCKPPIDRRSLDCIWDGVQDWLFG